MVSHGDDKARSADGADEAQEVDALEQRLRELHWPEPPPGVRERALADFQQRIEKLRAEQSVVADSD